MSWYVEFREYGGYDCMTSAYSVRHSDHWISPIILDCGTFQADADRGKRSEVPELRELAQAIADGLNAANVQWPAKKVNA